MSVSLDSAIARFGEAAGAKLASPTVSGEPEDQLRAPLETLLADMAELCRLAGVVVAIGESAVADLKTRPDYAVTVRGALAGFIEIKSPGKGADPRKFKDRHDRDQWEKLKSLPNLIYTDGNEFSLWRDGEPWGSIVRLTGDVETSGANLQAPPALLHLFENFLGWEPIPPRDAPQLAHVSARLCRLLRDEVTEQLAIGSPALTALATDWRKLLFPEASDSQFADGYAQAVTFGMLMARARSIELGTNLAQVAQELGRTNSLIGAALRLLTDDAENQATLKTSLGTLTRVLDAVHWNVIAKGDPDAWLYFYEQFLEVYDNELRKQTGSYYTPPEVVGTMVRLVDEALRGEGFALHRGLASPAVTLADPAVGTGTFLLGVFRRIAEIVAADEGPGAVAGAIDAAIDRLAGFEMQLGPFAVAQLRVLAELVELTGSVPAKSVRMFVTDTLGNPYIEEDWIPGLLEPIARSRREANRIKTKEPITVVIGNPPYREKAKGLGGWIEKGSPGSKGKPPLDAWTPPAEWGVSAHSKHLRNLYVYFWRWATWKVFDQDPQHDTGIVCFISVAGFLNGPGFQKMREYLRRTCDRIWVIDCSPEGHQPEVNTRIFQKVQQPVCIVLASRSKATDENTPAKVRFHALEPAHRQEKFRALGRLKLSSRGVWTDCPTEWRAAFLPKARGAWPKYPALDRLFVYDGSGVMAGRTWVIAPDAQSLKDRWRTLIKARPEKKEELFHPHLRGGEPGDKHLNKAMSAAITGSPIEPKSVAEESGDCLPPVRYGFRSFDRQWIIPDDRVINRPNRQFFDWHSDRQVYLTAPSDRSPTAGPALSFTALIPDLHHYHGRGGRAFPLWRDPHAKTTNVSAKALDVLSKRYKKPVAPDDLFAYLAAVAAHPAYTARFQDDLINPGWRIPITAKARLFFEAAELGRTIIWLHTFGERFAGPKGERPAGSPRLPRAQSPRISAKGAIPQTPEAMPDAIVYDAGKRRLLIGTGYIDNVPPEVWAYEVSGKQVLRQWFSYRRANRERPIVGTRRKPSPLGDIQPDHWLAEYTTELIDLLHVLGRLVELEPKQAQLLERICAGELIPAEELEPTRGGSSGGRGGPSPPVLHRHLPLPGLLFDDID
ncbi:MAG: type ISP restriction/modification enzyme [Planctomycetaceae bacterium]